MPKEHPDITALKNRMTERLDKTKLRHKEDYVELIQGTQQPDAIRCKVTGHVVARLQTHERLGNIMMMPTNSYSVLTILFDNTSKHQTPISKKGLRMLKGMQQDDLLEALEDITMADLMRLQDTGLTNLNGFKNRIPIGIEA